MNDPFDSRRAGGVSGGLILLILIIMTAGLLAGVVTLQWRERSFYAATPSAWPAPGSVAAVPAAPSTSAIPVLPPVATP